MPIIDPILQAENLVRMKYVEFQEFLCRVAYEMAHSTRQSQGDTQSEASGMTEPIWFKIERLLSQLAYAINYSSYQPLFKRPKDQSGAGHSSVVDENESEMMILN